MRFDYFLYPSALEKITSSGIAKRVEQMVNGHKIPYLGGYVSEEDVTSGITALQQDGFYDALPVDVRDTLLTTVRACLRRGPEHSLWRIETPAGPLTEPADLLDLRLFSGEFASQVLPKEELWNFASPGFSSPVAFAATVGAYVYMRNIDTNVHKGYVWERRLADGTVLRNEITGDHNGDLRLYQTDQTPYPAFDPFGTSVEFRPVFGSDLRTVAAYHSTESHLFAAVLKYMDQQGLAQDHLREHLLERVGDIPPVHLSPAVAFPQEHFVSWEIPLPQLDAENRTHQRTFRGLATPSDGFYGCYVAANGDFVLSYETLDTSNPVKPLRLRFGPDDAGELLFGLLFQAAHSLGRTHVRQLADMLDYRFSDAFTQRRH